MEKYLALKASAGSGKTFALTVRYITLLLFDVKPNEILTLTFTNKAAAQMSQRVLQTLQTLGEDETYLSEISKLSKLSKDEIVLQKNRLLESFTNSSLSIFTIDKFVNKILKEFSGYIGVSDDFEILNDEEELLGFYYINSLEQRDFKDLVEFSRYEKRRFSSIFTLFKELIEKNEIIEPLEIDIELINSIKELVLEDAKEIKEYFLNLSEATPSAKKSVQITDFDDLLDKTWVQRDSLFDFVYFKKYANQTIDDIFLNMKNNIRKYYKLRAAYSISKVYNLYLNFKKFKSEFNRRKNYYEFNDISNMVYELLSSKIDRDFLYFRLDSSYNHILIDEFQDTSTLQYKILSPLIEEIISSKSDKFKTFFYVGDPKQSIYRFRGGNKKLFDYVLNKNSQIVLNSLNTNYRSSSNLVEFVNDIFLKVQDYDYEKQNSIKDGGYIEIIEDKSEDENRFESLKVKIEELIKSGINSSDIAILCYTNSDVLETYSYLKENLKDIKIQTDMSSKLINSQNVKALINLIKYLYFKEEIYKENYNSLVGKDLNSEVILDFDFEEKSMYEVVHILAYKYELMDENIVTLLEIIKDYKNVVEFVYKIDRLDTSINNSENSGLQILTIFKSKGLEFHTVILLDRIKGKRSSGASLLFSYKDIEIQNIYYKIKNFENFNDDYKEALEVETNLIQDDEKNVLYVALTRAKKNMIIFKKLKSSAFEILNLSSFQKGILEKSLDEKEQETIEKIEYKSLFLGKQEQKIKVDSIFDEEYLKARYIGLATHYALEMMNDFTTDDLEYSLNLAKSRYLSYLTVEDFLNIKILLEKLIEDRVFSKLIAGAKKLGEQSLMYEEELKIIDLLLYKDGVYTIIDYKTTSEILSSHKNQVNYYKKAISDIFNTKNVEAYLIYLRKEKIEIIKA